MPVLGFMNKCSLWKNIFEQKFVLEPGHSSWIYKNSSIVIHYFCPRTRTNFKIDESGPKIKIFKNFFLLFCWKAFKLPKKIFSSVLYKKVLKNSTPKSPKMRKKNFIEATIFYDKLCPENNIKCKIFLSLLINNISILLKKY